MKNLQNVDIVEPCSLNDPYEYQAWISHCYHPLVICHQEQTAISKLRHMMKTCGGKATGVSNDATSKSI